MLKKTFAYRWIVFKHESCSIKIPVIYGLFDRFYFGALGRFLVRFPVFVSSVNMGTHTLYRLLGVFDRRRVVVFNTISDFKTPKNKTLIWENLLSFAIKLFWKH
jgi:hypothetical protein